MRSITRDEGEQHSNGPEKKIYHKKQACRITQINLKNVNVIWEWMKWIWYTEEGKQGRDNENENWQDERETDEERKEQIEESKQVMVHEEQRENIQDEENRSKKSQRLSEIQRWEEDR